MSYHVATVKPCEWCGTPTTKRQNRTRKPQCLDCGLNAAVSNVTGQQAPGTPARLAYCASTIRWAENGGIERADQGELWRARMRKHVQRCRDELAKAGGTPPAIAK